MLFEDVVSMRAGAHAAELDLVEDLVARATSIKELRDAFRPSANDTANTVWVEKSILGTFIVVRRTQLRQVKRDARFWNSCKTHLFGEFKRREHADRWAVALLRSAIPRNTRRLQRKRAEASEPPVVMRYR